MPDTDTQTAPPVLRVAEPWEQDAWGKTFVLRVQLGETKEAYAALSHADVLALVEQADDLGIFAVPF